MAAELYRVSWTRAHSFGDDRRRISGGDLTCVGMIFAAATMSRTIAASGGGFGGGGFGIPIGGGGLGIGTVVVLGLIGWALGIDPSILIGGAESSTAAAALSAAVSTQPTRAAPARRPTRRAISSPPCSATPKTPGPKFSSSSGQQYRAPRLRLFSGADAGRLRLCAGGDGAVLLPERPAHLSRHLVLPRHAARASAAAAARPANSPRPM